MKTGPGVISGDLKTKQSFELKLGCLCSVAAWLNTNVLDVLSRENNCVFYTWGARLLRAGRRKKAARERERLLSNGWFWQNYGGHFKVVIQSQTLSWLFVNDRMKVLKCS